MFSERPSVGPWLSPVWGIDLAPKGTQKEFQAILLEMADWLKAKHKELGWEGMLIIHPNTNEGRDFVGIQISMQRDHFYRIWKLAGPLQRLHNMWQGLINSQPSNRDLADKALSLIGYFLQKQEVFGFGNFKFSISYLKSML